MRIAILTANLGNFDKPVDPVKQETEHEIKFHRFTDDDFPPITGLTPRLQYRIPKCFGWEMFPGYDYYIWLDGACSFERPDCVWWYVKQLADNDMAFFKHPSRRNVRQEVRHLEEHLNLGKPYITKRYKNGLHREFFDKILAEGYRDKGLYASTTFIYKNNPQVQKALTDWWLLGSRYFTCDQIQLPYVLWKNEIRVKTFDEPLYKSGYISLVSKHN
jgi:hypothetical protein